MSSVLTIYYTSDTHGYLYPTHFRDKNPHPMGVLSMCFPKDENTLIISLNYYSDEVKAENLTMLCKKN